MRRIYLTCPRTGRRVDTGVTVDRASLADYVPRNARTFCTHCGHTHPWDSTALVLDDLPVSVNDGPPD